MKQWILGLATLALIGSATAAMAGDSDTIATGSNEGSLSTTSPDLQRAEVSVPPIDTASAYAVENVSFSSASQNFYFVLDGYSVSPGDTSCGNGSKFGIRADAPHEGLIDQVKMAFLSGRKVKVQWSWEDCVGGAPAPHYIKTYR